MAAPVAAQDSRADLIDRARTEAQDSVRLRLLLSAADPTLAQPDSLWAVGVFDLSQTLLLGGEESLASTWLRWVARHGPDWAIDPTWFHPDLVAEYGEASASVEEETDDPTQIGTVWSWPERFDPGANGVLQVRGVEGTASASVTVEGEETFPLGGSLSLTPGTYQVDVSAEGHEAVRVVREILPGVTTTLDVRLAPLLPAQARETALETLVRISGTGGALATCGTGVLAHAEGLILTSYDLIRGGNDLHASVGPEGIASPVTVAATDSVRALAVLRLPEWTGGTPPAPGPVTDGAYTWSTFYEGCDVVASERTRLSGWIGPRAGPVGLAPALPAGALGAPLVDRTGAWMGVVTGPGSMIPRALALDLVEEAQQQVAIQMPTGGGFPWKWVGAGTAVVGALAAVLTRGGDDPPNPPTTGDMLITFPGGSP